MSEQTGSGHSSFPPAHALVSERTSEGPECHRLFLWLFFCWLLAWFHTLRHPLHRLLRACVSASLASCMGTWTDSSNTPATALRSRLSAWRNQTHNYWPRQAPHTVSTAPACFPVWKR